MDIIKYTYISNSSSDTKRNEYSIELKCKKENLDFVDKNHAIFKKIKEAKTNIKRKI